MEESCGAQFALQVALQTLRDRCQRFQQRIVDLECENVYLKSKCKERAFLNSPIHEFDSLNSQIVQLTEQKLQLTKKVEMVAAENTNLWNRLSKLTQVKENLDSKLIKINDTISNHIPHSNLVRSKTFTQKEPHAIFQQNAIRHEKEKISLELEDISLQLLNSIAKEKQELEMQCSQMAEMQMNDFSSAYAFTTTDDIAEYDQVEKQLTSLKNIKLALLKQKENLEDLESSIAARLSANNDCTTCQRKKNTFSTSVQTSHNRSSATDANNDCTTCQLKKNTVSTSVQTSNRSSVTDDESAQLQSLMNWGTPDNSFSNEFHNTTTKNITNTDAVRICPMCNKIFYNSANVMEFEVHVHQHFRLENDASFEVV